jgi:hypothetical protein
MTPDNESVPIVTFYQYTSYQGEFLQFRGSEPCSSSNGGYAISDTRPIDYSSNLNWGASSWQASSSCWHTTIYYGYDYGSPQYQYAQGVWEAAVIGDPWNNHIWSLYTAWQ